MDGSPRPPAGRPAGLDEAFPRRVVRMSLLLTLLGVIYACLAGAWRTAIGLGAGGALSAAAFVTLAWTVHLWIGGAGKRGWRTAGVLLVVLLKMPLLALALWFAVSRLDAQPIALLAGLAMTQIVMVLKVAGIRLVTRAGRVPSDRAR
jgi:hypothetical protein